MCYCTLDNVNTMYLRGKYFLFRFLLLFLEEVAKEYENSFSFGLFFVNVCSKYECSVRVTYECFIRECHCYLKLHFKSSFVCMWINRRQLLDFVLNTFSWSSNGSISTGNMLQQCSEY